MLGGPRRSVEAELDELNTLDELSPAERAAAGDDGMLEFGFDLPMPGVSYLELVPPAR